MGMLSIALIPGEVKNIGMICHPFTYNTPPINSSIQAMRMTTV